MEENGGSNLLEAEFDLFEPARAGEKPKVGSCVGLASIVGKTQLRNASKQAPTYLGQLGSRVGSTQSFLPLIDGISRVVEVPTWYLL